MVAFTLDCSALLELGVFQYLRLLLRVSFAVKNSNLHHFIVHLVHHRVRVWSIVIFSEFRRVGFDIFIRRLAACN
eukprot:COSAG06_NODE_182_length_20899_cov_89.175048_13_plen_75_part_00